MAFLSKNANYIKYNIRIIQIPNYIKILYQNLDTRNVKYLEIAPIDRQ